MWWKSLRYLANKYNFILINDGCHAMGSKLDNQFGYAKKFADFVTQVPSVKHLLR